MFRRLLRDDSGQGLAEYGLILTFIALACLIGLTGLGTTIAAQLTAIGGDL
jgi:pilus assembly protein Flp/PilA